MSSISKNNINHKHYDDMMLALLPLILCAMVMYSARVLLICAAAFITARIVDVGMAVIRNQPIDSSDKSSTVAALTFCMMLPVTVPLYVVVVTIALTIMVGKHAFGGKDAYPFSLAALAMCTAAVNWPTQVFRAVKPFTKIDFWTGAGASAATSSLQIKTGGLPYVSTLNLFLGNYAGAIGSSFIIIIIAIAIFLLVTKRITWHIPLTFLVTCSTIAMIFPRIYGISAIDSFKYEILTSALVFNSVFLLNEPATTPKRPQAKIVFGVLCGVLTMIFRYYGSFEIGACFALLLVNATEGYWDRLFMSKSEKARIKADEEADKPVKKQVKKNTYTQENPAKTLKTVHKADVKEEKPVKNKEKELQKNNGTSARKSTLDIISRAEDDIDQVEFSTQTIDVEQALRELEERYLKGGK